MISILFRLYSSEHLSDSLLLCEEVHADILEWAGETDMRFLTIGFVGAMRAIAGKTINTSPETVLDSEDFCAATDLPVKLAEVVSLPFATSALIVSLSLFLACLLVLVRAMDQVLQGLHAFFTFFLLLPIILISRYTFT